MKKFSGMRDDRLSELVRRFSGLQIAVLGDFFLDKYLDVDPSLAEYSIETGKTAHQVVEIRKSPGAAGTVVCNLAALRGNGADTAAKNDLYAIGFTGDDGESYDLRAGLAELGCDTEHLHRDPRRMTPTYLKPRDRGDGRLEGEHERYDTKNRQATSASVQAKIIESLDSLLPRLEAVVVLDQVEEPECGVVTTRVREALAQRAKRYPDVVFWVDSRRRINEFRGMTIKPNQFEAMGIDNPPPGQEVDIEELCRSVETLRAKTGAAIFATRGTEGMMVCDEEITLVPTVRVDGPTDPTGAGDSATSGAVLALAAGAQADEAALVGNLVASITVQQLATTGTASPAQVAERLQEWNKQHNS